MKLASEGKRIKSYIHILGKDMLQLRWEMTSSTSLVTLFFPDKMQQSHPLVGDHNGALDRDWINHVRPFSSEGSASLECEKNIGHCGDSSGTEVSTLHATRQQVFKLRSSTHPPCTMTLPGWGPFAPGRRRR